MMTKINCFIFALISIVLLISPQNPTASTTADVKYDGNRLSVNADKVVLDQLLSMVAKQTGIQFSYSDLASDIDVSVNFENNTLADGIRRILLHFNYAVIYDGSGQVESVLVLNRQGASSKSSGYPAGLFASHPQTGAEDILATSPDPLDAHPNAAAGIRPDQVETTPFSEQISEQEASGPDSPSSDEESPEEASSPGSPSSDEESQAPMLDPNANAPPPPGEEALAPVVDPNTSPPPDEDSLAPVVDEDAPPPPGEDLLEQESDAENTIPSDTEGQAVPQVDQNPG